jgi:chromosome segregation ATPase
LGLSAEVSLLATLLHIALGVRLPKALKVAMATVQEALTGYRRKIDEIRQIQSEAEEAHENIRTHASHEEAYTEALAQVAARLATETHSGLERSAVVFDALVRENKDLKDQIDRLKSHRVAATPTTVDDEDDDADDHFFGTHLREVWAFLRHK